MYKRQPRTLPQDGTYYVGLDGSGLSEGNVIAVTGELTAAAVDPTPLARDVPGGHPFTVAGDGQVAVMHFEASAGELLGVGLALDSDADWWLADPDGFGISIADTAHTPLAKTGTYTIAAYRPWSGPALAGTVWLSTPQTDPVPLVIGDPAGRTITVDVPNASRELTFAVTPGAPITLTSPAGSSSVLYCLYAPGAPSPTCTNATSVPIDPTKVGTWRIRVTQIWATPVSRSFYLSRALTPVALATNAPAGVVLPFTVPGQPHTVTFEGVAGTRVRLAARASTPGGRFTFSMRDPGGQQVLSDETLSTVTELQSSSSGTYVLTITDRDGTFGGDLQLWLSTPKVDPVPLVRGVTPGRLLDFDVPGRQADVRFVADGGPVTIRVPISTFFQRTSVRVIGPNGLQVNAFYPTWSASTQTLVLTNTVAGTYHLLLTEDSLQLPSKVRVEIQ